MRSSSENTHLIQELSTIRDFVRYAASSFEAAGLYYGHGTDCAWDEATALVFGSVHFPLDGETMALDAKLCAAEKHYVLALIQERIEQRIPVPYLVQRAQYGGHQFVVNESVLIPRSSLQEVIAARCMPFKEPENVHHILDLCTGSGALAILAAYAFPNAHIDAIDNSLDALQVAQENVNQHGFNEQINLQHSDLFDALRGNTYDIIFTNPPYVSREEYDSLPEEYQREPESALYSAQNGLEHTLKILHQAVDYLNDDGLLFVEVGNTGLALTNAFPDIPFRWIDCEGEGGIFVCSREDLLEWHIPEELDQEEVQHG